ncbi:hypothetical protein [Bradyrhizobium sp. RT10b]|uniref:hypothetical protein n=1 Tax=Bradyrhizobium sp. RT10b TaxID=3156331 RepID=UPI0033954E25
MTEYQPTWLRLIEAKARIVSAHSMDELGAEAWLIRAIQDQLRADPEGYAAQTMFRVQGFPTQWRRRRFPRDWPARLTPDRVDWQASTIHGLHPVTLMETDLFIEVSAAALGTGQQPGAASGRPVQRVGSPELYDWDDIEQFIRREIDKRGDFAKPENRQKGWRSQNDLIEVITDYLERRNESVPGPSRFKVKVASILIKVRNELAAGH